MQKNKALRYISVFIITLQICFYSSVMASALEILQVVADGGTCCFFAEHVYNLGKGVNTLLRPSQERQDRVQDIQEQLKLIRLREDFVTCLVENRTSTQKGSIGIPSECEDAALLFAGAGAVNEAERMVTVFKALNK